MWVLPVSPCVCVCVCSRGIIWNTHLTHHTQQVGQQGASQAGRQELILILRERKSKILSTLTPCNRCWQVIHSSAWESLQLAGVAGTLVWPLLLCTRRAIKVLGSSNTCPDIWHIFYQALRSNSAENERWWTRPESRSWNVREVVCPSASEVKYVIKGSCSYIYIYIYIFLFSSFFLFLSMKLIKIW